MTNLDQTPLCRSDYYADTGRRQHPGDRIVRCGLPKSHEQPADHAELDDDDQVMATWPPRQPKPAAELDDDDDQVIATLWGLLHNARAASRRLTAALIAVSPHLTEPPWTHHIAPGIDQLRAALGMRGAWPTACACYTHGRNCEPPSELCCDRCGEIQHPHHVDGSVCSAPDLSGTAMPTPVEIALRAEVLRLQDTIRPGWVIAALRHDTRLHRAVAAAVADLSYAGKQLPPAQARHLTEAALRAAAEYLEGWVATS